MPSPDPEESDAPTPTHADAAEPSSASTASSASGGTERGAPSSAAVPASIHSLAPPEEHSSHAEENLSVTPTAASALDPTTPPASTRSLSSTTAPSPAPTSSPTPNPHRRTLSSASAGTSSSLGGPPSSSAVSSPARREFGGPGGDVSEEVLHEESAEEDEDAPVGEGSYFSSVHNTPSAQAGARPRPSSALGGGPRPRPPPPLGFNRRSISVNTALSNAGAPSSTPGPAPGHSNPARRSMYHLAAPPAGPTHSASASAAGTGVRTPTMSAFPHPPHPPHSGPHAQSYSYSSSGAHPHPSSQNRSVSRMGRAPSNTSGYDMDREYDSAAETDAADEDLLERERRRRAMSPAIGRRAGDEDDVDDEVILRDRGEELVRRRMRERKEKRRQAQQEAAFRLEQSRRLSSYTPTHAHTPAGGPPFASSAFDASQQQAYPESSYPYPYSDSLGLGYPSSGAHGARSRVRDPSTARSERSQAYSVFSDGPGGGGGGRPTSPIPAQGQAQGGLWSPMPVHPPSGRPAIGPRATSYLSSANGSVSGASTAGGRDGDEGEEQSVVEGESGGGAPSQIGEEEEDEDDVEDRDVEELLGEEPRMEDWADGGADGEHEGDVDGEVEYTLKDRQDAINVEHPFGLPIWKPALYKKSRSIARHADAALHSAPSSTAQRHLLPVNVAWTLFAGLWLCLACMAVGTVLWFTPWGGRKYGRVIWELGGYLFWPFGKYVEGWGEDHVPGEEEWGVKPIEEENEEGEDDEEDEVEREGQGQSEGSYREDPEASGRTYRRNRSGTINGHPTTASSVDGLFGEGQVNLPDEPPRRMASQASLRPPQHERSGLLQAPGQARPKAYGTAVDKSQRSSSEETACAGGNGNGSRTHDLRAASDSSAKSTSSPFRPRALGRLMYWTTFYLVVAPLMLFVCIVCWALVFFIPMAKLLWVLLWHLNNEPLSLHFRSPPKYASHLRVTPAAPQLDAQHGNAPLDLENQATTFSPATDVTVKLGQQQPSVPLDRENQATISSVATDATARPPVAPSWPLKAGQPAPRLSRKSVATAKKHGRLLGPHSTVLLCTYKAAGLEYYKYTLDGVNIWFVNLMSLVFFVIADFFLLEPYAEEHHSGGLLAIVTGQAFMFVIALLSAIPLSYFIGMAVASISAQSSIGTGAFINASFGSAIEILLYGIALTKSKAELVEGSIVGSILAGVLLMPGASMIGGAFKRKEQRFNARSAGVTSTMLIMAVIGTLTPTLFYEIYGSFQLTCNGCDPASGDGSATCRTCYYEHIDPADDPFYKGTVRYLSYYCGIILVLSYAVGIWFSLRTHASQIWQNAAPTAHEHGLGRSGAQQLADQRRSLYQRVIPSQLFQQKRRASATGNTPLGTPLITPTTTAPGGGKLDLPPMQLLPNGLTPEEFNRAVEVVASAASAIRPGAPLHRAASHVREASAPNKEEEADGHGGHDAPNWSRAKSTTVLFACTFLYAIIAEILVDVVDVVLDGSGIPEKFLGVTLFALVPNTTEFMNAISFALNGNIALSMEIGSAYALQVCLIQAPAMLAFSAYYGIGKESMLHRAFTLVFPRWDVIAILFSIFLLTYVYIEARSNYFRGVLLCLSYFVLLSGFAMAPVGRDTVDNPGFGPLAAAVTSPLSTLEKVKAVFLALFTK
ncbi:hypothetical protein JCM21900_004764 [Sporobolomyces salmonicolor]